jgi:hypothetical protein
MPRSDIQAGIVEAQRTGKCILPNVGGGGQYCHPMDQLSQEHPELLALRDKNFISWGYYGTDRQNEPVLTL